MLVATVNNLPTHSLRRWVVVRYDETTQKLWYYANFDDKGMADIMAHELDNGLVVENTDD